jgi:hypothetical protein
MRSLIFAVSSALALRLKAERLHANADSVASDIARKETHPTLARLQGTATADVPLIY